MTAPPVLRRARTTEVPGCPGPISDHAVQSVLVTGIGSPVPTSATSDSRPVVRSLAQMLAVVAPLRRCTWVKTTRLPSM